MEVHLNTEQQAQAIFNAAIQELRDLYLYESAADFQSTVDEIFRNIQKKDLNTKLMAA